MNPLQRILEDPMLQPLLAVAASVVVAFLLVHFLRRTVRRRVADDDLRYRASKMVGAFGYFIVLATIIVQLGGRVSGFTVALGAAGAGVAFALQEVIASFAGWLAISLGGYYKVGDRVQLGGIKGDVIDIGLIRTTLMEIGGWVDGDLYNGRVVRIGNSFVFKEPVFNYSGEFPFVWDEIRLPVKYGSDREAARRLLERAAEEVVAPQTEEVRAHWERLVRSFRIERARIEPMVTMTANDNWIEYTLRYVVDHKARRATKDRLFERILDLVDVEPRVGIASATFHLVEAPRLSVKLDSTPED